MDKTQTHPHSSTHYQLFQSPENPRSSSLSSALPYSLSLSPGLDQARMFLFLLNTPPPISQPRLRPISGFSLFVVDALVVVFSFCMVDAPQPPAWPLGGFLAEKNWTLWLRLKVAFSSWQFRLSLILVAWFLSLKLLDSQWSHRNVGVKFLATTCIETWLDNEFDPGSN